MSKRFTDTTIWSKEWFMELTPVEKCAIFYIKDACDNVGVWKPNLKLAEFQIGEAVGWAELLEKCNDNISVLPDGKWWLIDFVEFQYGELKESCKPHLSYISLLKKHGLLKGYRKGINTHKEKDKDKDIEKDKEKESLIDDIIEFFNRHTGSHVRQGTEAIRSKIRARLSEGHTFDDCKRAIALCHEDWKDTEYAKFIRIPTIFGAEKFSGYVDAHYHMTEDEA